MEIYLDNSATTKMSESSVKAVMDIMTNIYGNPSSLHSKGLEAEHALKNARRAVADSLSVSENEIFFTSGGTEANNLAVRGSVYARIKRGNKIVISAIEHSSIFECCHALENEGFQVVYVKPDSSGNISIENIADAVDEKTILVSVMYVNNEVGSVLPVESVRRIIKRKNAPALFHVDAVQAYGKIPIKPQKIDCDLLTVSAHKIHGPKGCGALYIKKGVYIKPLLYGGEQEKKIRPGTETLPLICGFGAAAGELGTPAEISARLKNIEDLRNYAVSELKKISGIEFNSPENALPYILNISAIGIRSETMLHFLEKKDIFISSGSACAKGKKSHVLSAMELDPKRIDSALRISFSSDSTKEEVDILVESLKEGLNTLVKSVK